MRILRTLFILASLLAVGCQADRLSKGGDGDVVVVGDKTILTLSSPTTRVHLGEKSGEKQYRTYWSEGDVIVVNGVFSSKTTLNTPPTSAKFEFDTTLEYPYYITYGNIYPYPQVIVDFPNVQEHTEGSFMVGSTPMFGYVEKEGDAATMQHLAGVIRLSVKGLDNETTLQTITVRTDSGRPIAGWYCVNRILEDQFTEVEVEKSGGVTPFSDIEENDSNYNTITYNCDTSKPLSTSKESIYYIAMPEGEHGPCHIEFVDIDGKSMSCRWLSGTVNAGVVRSFSTVTFEPDTNHTLKDMEVEYDTFDDPIFGYVVDSNNQPIAGVAVSDGFSVVQTNEKGYYSFVPSSDTWYIFVSLPSEYEVPINEHGQPCFYKRYTSNIRQYNFTLTPLKNGKEEKFALFAIADPQIYSDGRLNRFNNEAIPGVKAHCTEVTNSGIPCYGITLGDIISNTDTSDVSHYRDDMRDGFAASKVGMPVFQVMGNHDNNFVNSANPVTADAHSSTWQIKFQRDHEDIYGPVNYSFNRGDVHIVGMRNILYKNPDSYSSTIGFSDEQYEWLKQDLALVPKDKMVVLCVHIPMLYNSAPHNREILQLLNEYKEAHILSGHQHYNRNYYHPKDSSSGLNIYEHVVNSLGGSWWFANIAADGTPNGYQVFIGDGNTFSDWYYMGWHEGMNTREHQMRLYRGDAITGGAKSGTDSYGVMGYYKFNYGSDVLLANIYNSDTGWSVKVYEDGEYTGDMTHIAMKHRPFHDNNASTTSTNIGGSGTYAAPYYSMVANVSSDIYFAGLFLGILGEKDGVYHTKGGCYHMWKYTLQNPSATEIKVVAIDKFGNEYTETNITNGTDYTNIKLPKSIKEY